MLQAHLHIFLYKLSYFPQI